MPPDHIQQKSGGRSVALVCDLVEDGLVRVIVEIKRVVRENRVIPQTERLVHLEIKADGYHGSMLAVTRPPVAGIV